jgi:hypothetical protein
MAKEGCMLFSNERRRLLAKTMMDLVKVEAAVGFASFFFRDMSKGWRLSMGFVFVALILFGFLIEPTGDKERVK